MSAVEALSQTLTSARTTLEIEAKSIMALIDRLGADFERACSLILEAKGRLIVTGMGKSGHIASKIAATFASTGTLAFFVHPAEAQHGDLGMIAQGDIVLALSNSGNTEELLDILPALKRKGIKLIAMCGNLHSELALLSDVNLNVAVAREACPLNLAPTASTTACLAMGDALAVAVLEARGFNKNDFALSHPAGKLGKRLLLRVETIMHKGIAVPKVAVNAKLKDVVLEISSKCLGMSAVTDEHENIVGICTDGDIRRAFEHNLDLNTVVAKDIMTSNFVRVTQDLLAVDALELMEKHKIFALPVVAANKIIGAFNMHDLLKSGVA